MKAQGFSMRPVALAVAASLALGGCAVVGPNFSRPEAPVAEQWSAAGDTKGAAQEPADYREWWKVLGDPTLDRLIDLAYAQNLPLQVAGLRVLEARAQLGVAIGNLYPQLQQVGGSAFYNQLSKNRANLGAADRNYGDWGVGAGATWELDLWGRFRRVVESADASLLASVAGYDDVLVSLTADVARTYVVIRTFQERLSIAARNVRAQRASLELADTRFREGAATELDVQQGKALLFGTQATIPLLVTGLRQAEHALSVLLGQPPGDLAALVGEGPIPRAPAAVAVGIPADLLRRRPDVQRAELQAAAQSAQIGFAESELYPRFSLLGSIGLRTSTGVSGSGAGLGDLFELNSIEILAGPSLTWNVLNYGQLTNNVRVQDARFQQLVVNYQDTVLRAAREVEDNLVAFLQGQEQVKLLSGAVLASSRGVEIALLQYREGKVDYQRVIEGQRALLAD